MQGTGAPASAAVHATAVLEKLSHTASTARAQVMRRPPLATGFAVALILILGAIGGALVLGVLIVFI